MDKKDVLQQVQREFENKRQMAESKAQVAYDFACKNNNFAQLESERRNLVFEIGKSMFFGKPTEDMKNRLDEIATQQIQVLADMGMSKADLEPQYECPLCNDKGFVDGKRCQCFQQAINKLLSQNSNLCDTTLSLDSVVAKNDLQNA